MKPSVTFTVPGKAVSKKRHRMTKRGHTYTPADTVSYEGMVKVLAYNAMEHREVLTGPIDMRVTVYLAPPKSWSKRRHDLALDDCIIPTKKPDLSNVAKSIEDAMNGVVYRDDSQITQLTVSKWYSDEERVEVWVQEVDRMSAP